MVFSIIAAIVAVFVVVVIVQGRRAEEPWSGIAGEVTGVLAAGAVLGGIVMLFAGAISSLVIDPDTGWEVQSETTYTVAEGSDISVDDSSTIKFVESKDGKLADVELDFIDGVVYVEGSETARTVMIREEHRELGTALFPWGVGDDMTTATIK